MSDIKRAYNIAKGYVQREFDRIQGLEEDAALAELDEPLGGRRTSDEEVEVVVRRVVFDAGMARRYLGVEDNASFEEIKGKYNELTKRSDPSRCSEGSAEHRMAIEIQRRLHLAYSLLTQEFSTTQKRFASLEVEGEAVQQPEIDNPTKGRFASLEVQPEPLNEEK